MKYRATSAIALTAALACAIPAFADTDPSPPINAVCTECGPQSGTSALLQQAYVFGNGWDYRQQVLPSNLGPLRAVGQMRMTRADGHKFTASGFLISPCHVLTNAHVASDLEFNRPWQSVTFAIGDYLISVNATRIEDGKGHPTITLMLSDADEDWEVVRLEECVGDNYGFLPLRRAVISEDELGTLELVSVGFPKNFDWRKGLVIDPLCTINTHFRYKGMKIVPQYATLCSGDQGDSGGPLVTREAFPVVVAMHSGEGSGPGKRNPPLQQEKPDFFKHIFNDVTPMSGLYDKVAQILSRPEESAYVHEHSTQAMPQFGPVQSTAGKWQRPDTGAPPMPFLNRNHATRPKHWKPVLSGLPDL